MESKLNDSQAQKRKYWGQHLQDWQESGMTQRAYCSEHGLCTKTLYYWRCKLFPKTEKGTSLSPPSRLRQVNAQAHDIDGRHENRSASIQVRFSDCFLALEGPVDEDQLRSVVRVLRGN